MQKSSFARPGRWAIRASLAGLLAVSIANSKVGAQEGQGKYITEASARLIKLVNLSNKDGFVLQDNSFSIGGGWLKQSTQNWVPLFSVQLLAGKEYRFLAAGDADAKDVDLQVLDANGNAVAVDEATNPEAVVSYRPTVTGQYLVRLRLYDSVKNQSCMCLGVVMNR